MKKISIITVSYNSEKTIERTITSVLSQNFEDYEYIIVDGASKDSTLQIIKKYESDFVGKLIWISEPDSGIYNAMNKGVEMASGEIIGIVNSDDWLEPNALHVVYELSRNTSNFRSSLFCGSVYFHYADGDKQLFLSDKKRFYEGIPHHSYNFGAYHPAIFVGRDVYSSVGLFDENFKIEADTDFIYRCYKDNKNFVFTSCVLSNMADGGASNVVDFKKYYREKKYFLKKNGIKGMSAMFLMTKFIIRICFKKFIPNSLSKVIREVRTKQ